MAENFFKFLSLSLYEKEKKESTIPFLFPIIINNTFQKRIKTERFLSEKKKRETNFNQNRQQKKKKKKDAYSSQHSISLPIKFLRQSDHAFEQESILHFVLHPPPVLYVFRHVHYYPIYRAERRRTDIERERERRVEKNNERTRSGKKGWMEAVAYNFSSLSLPFFLQKSMQIAAMHVSSRESYLWGMIFGGPDLCARIPPMCLRLCWRRFIGGLPSPWVKTIPKRLSAN